MKISVAAGKWLLIKDQKIKKDFVDKQTDQCMVFSAEYIQFRRKKKVKKNSALKVMKFSEILVQRNAKDGNLKGVQLGRMKKGLRYKY